MESRTCNRCGQCKSNNEFYVYNNAACKDCLNQKRREDYRSKPRGRNGVKGETVCNKCKQPKPGSEYYRSRNVRCKECIIKATLERRKDNPEKFKANELKSQIKSRSTPEKRRHKTLRYNYKIGIDDYQRMVSVCDSKCESCGRKIDKPFVDHCHTTQQVRGLLCHGCNVGIGMFGDNADKLRNAANYVALSHAMYFAKQEDFARL